MMEAFNRRFFDDSVHALDLPVGPRAVRLDKPVLNTICLTDHVEAHLPLFEELPSCSLTCLVDQLGDGKLTGAVNADEQIEFAFGGLYLSDIYVEEAYGIAFEALALGLVALDVRQTGYAVSLGHRCSADRVKWGIFGPVFRSSG